MYFLVIGGHIVLDLPITLKRKNNYSTEFSLFKLVENEIFCQKLKILDGRYGNHLGFDVYMTLYRKNNHANEISVFKLVKNEVLHTILGIFCQKLKI